MNPETLDEVLSNIWGFAASVFVVAPPAPPYPTYIVNIAICS